MKIRVSSFVAAAAAAAFALPAFAAPLPCEVVATRGDSDPEGNELTNRFRAQVAINSDGDVLFTARPLVPPPGKSRDRLYLYGNRPAPRPPRHASQPALRGRLRVPEDLGHQ